MDVDVAVVGGGIAGISVAAELISAGPMTVVVLEQEPTLAYHASGRSVAAFLESYGSAEIRALTRASRPYLGAAEMGSAPLLTPRALLWVAAEPHVERVEHLLATEPLLREVDEAAVRELCPVIRADWLRAAAMEPGAQDIDVAGLFDRYRRAARTGGATILAGAAVLDGELRDGTWLLRTQGGPVRAGTVVNAAGAWADELARRCGVAPVGLAPMRRTVAIASADVDRAWPLVCDVADGFYFRPEGDALLVSPVDETLVEPADVRAEVEDVALALDAVNDATTLGLRHVRTSWAGLRTFAPDRNPVVGRDPLVPSFVWLAGQGGYGMQTAPAMAQLAASVVLDAPFPDALTAQGLRPDRLSPARFTRG